MFSHACGSVGRKSIDFYRWRCGFLSPTLTPVASRGQLTAKLNVSLNCGGCRGALRRSELFNWPLEPGSVASHQRSMLTARA